MLDLVYNWTRIWFKDISSSLQKASSVLKLAGSRAWNIFNKIQVQLHTRGNCENLHRQQSSELKISCQKALF